MRLQEWQDDAERVLDQVIGGRVDVPWLDGEIRRLGKLRDRLPEPDQTTADSALDELEDYLDADVADEASPVDPAGPLAQAQRIRAQSYTVTGPDRVHWLKHALAKLLELADECTDAADAKAVRDITGVFDRELDRYR